MEENSYKREQMNQNATWTHLKRINISIYHCADSDFFSFFSQKSFLISRHFFVNTHFPVMNNLLSNLFKKLQYSLFELVSQAFLFVFHELKFGAAQCRAENDHIYTQWLREIGRPNVEFICLFHPCHWNHRNSIFLRFQWSGDNGNDYNHFLP